MNFRKFSKIKYLAFASVVIVLVSCITSKSKEVTAIKYLALGDSYTIGEGVGEKDRFPNLLKATLQSTGFFIENPTIIAKTGWRSDELIEALKAHGNDEKYDLVSLLIGVNNQYQGKSIEKFSKDLKELLRRSIQLSNSGNDGVFVLSIPDYGATPFAKENGPKIGAEIDEWNVVIKKMCNQYKIHYYDVTDISRLVRDRPGLLAADNLHPSREMYEMWVSQIQNPIEKKSRKNLK
jgi:acyl-CoA thioesterase-1